MNVEMAPAIVGYTDHIGTGREGPSTRRVFDGIWGKVYDRTMKQRWYSTLISPVWQGASRAIMREMFRLMDQAVDPAIPGAVLDVPCGGGPVLQNASARMVGTYVGVDLSPGQLRRASRMVADRQLQGKATLHRADARDLPFDDGTFARACSFNGLHLIVERAAVLAEIFRCLEPGGLFFGSTLVEPDRRITKLIRPWFFCLALAESKTADELAAYLSDAGFIDVGLFRSGPIVVFNARKPNGA